ncbi:hypothetical protein D9756_010895 [Leucocoprinus leucothites]|uniref:Extracellular serine-rich protein n=1 Tax=Leucocoprinus leucothites TaxID=201217 RepID=A0A8H5FQW0_9AGAR|nr:hypothetical protein D9756_010895 [Leucoagaricus leucothites]
MRFATVIASLSALSLAFAQNSNSTNSTVVTIQVGSTADAQGGIFQFIPPSVNATNGTVINFQFSGMPGNHSITQSTFSNPCTPMSGGFDSGWVWLPTPGLTPIPQWNLTVTDDSKPIWFFCKQLQPAPHCKAGMVGAINAPASGRNTFENYRSQANQADTSGQDVLSLVGVGASASARPGPLPSGATDYPAPSGSAAGGSGGNSGSGNDSGALGVSVHFTTASALVVLVAGMLFFA